MNYVTLFLDGLKSVLFLEKAVILLLVIVIFSFYDLKRTKEALRMFFTLFIGYAAVLGVTILEIIYLEKTIIAASVHVFVLMICLLNLFMSAAGVHSRRKKNNKSRTTIAVIGGVVTSFYIQNDYLGKDKITNLGLLGDNLLLNAGILVAMLAFMFLSLVGGSIFTNVVSLKKKEWVLFSSGICIGVIIMLLS